MSIPNVPSQNAPSRRRILLVEDNEAAAKGLSKLLEAYGFEVKVVADGVSALAAFEAGPPPDFLLTDLQLPDLDGREVARQASMLVPAPRVALITGWDLPSDAEEVARWGIDWIFPKPLDVKVLVAKLAESATPSSSSS